MSQNELSRDPAQNRLLLQLSLFGEYPDDVDDADDQRGQAEAADEVAADLGDDLEVAIHSGAGEPLKRRHPTPEPIGPDLDLNDERLLYFRHIGVRDLFAEMVVQSIRDLVYSKDEIRMARLLSKGTDEHEEMLFSAGWLDTNDGQLAVQILYPDWDHVTIVRRIHQDPQGILERMTQAGERRARDAASGFADASLSGGSDVYARIDDRSDDWSDTDVSGECHEGFRYN